MHALEYPSVSFSEQEGFDDMYFDGEGSCQTPDMSRPHGPRSRPPRRLSQARENICRNMHRGASSEGRYSQKALAARTLPADFTFHPQISLHRGPEESCNGALPGQASTPHQHRHSVSRSCMPGGGSKPPM